MFFSGSIVFLCYKVWVVLKAKDQLIAIQKANIEALEGLNLKYKQYVQEVNELIEKQTKDKEGKTPHVLH